LKAKLDTR